MAKRNLTFKLGLAALPALLLIAGWSAWRFLDDRTGILPRDPGAPAAEEIGGDTAPGDAAGGPSSPTSPANAETPVKSADLGSGQHSIEGTVLDPSGEPAPGAVVILISVGDERDTERGAGPDPGKAPAGSRVSTAADGGFRFAGVGPGLFRLAARQEGNLPAVSEVIAIGAEHESATAELRLRAGASLRGAVAGPDGSPVENALVRSAWRSGPPDTPEPGRRREGELLEEALSQREAEARSDAAGRFEIGGLLSGYHDLTVTARGHARAQVANAPTGDSMLRVVLRPELFLGGEVIDAEAKPVSGAEVSVRFLAADADAGDLLRLSYSSPESGVVSRARTGGDGRFACGGLASGAYQVQVDCKGYQQATALITAFHQSDSGEENPLVIRLEPGHRIVGSVRNAAGAPIAGADVRAEFLGPITSRSKRPEVTAVEQFQGVDHQATLHAHADGTFEFSSLPAGAYRLEVSAKSHCGKIIEEILTDGEPFDIELAPAVSLDLRVVDSRSKAPIARASVTHRPEKDSRTDPKDVKRVLRTDQEGRLRMDDLPEGRQVIEVEAEGYLSLVTPPLEAGEDPEMTIALNRGGSVSGRVRSTGGTPVEGLRVSLVVPTVAFTSEDGEFFPPGWDSQGAGPSGSTGVDGSYRIPNCRSRGSYQVLVEGRPYVTALSEVFEIPDPEAEVEGVNLELKIGATVRGRVVDGAGFAVPGAQAVALPAGPGASAAARADATGAFEISGLSGGQWRVIASAPGYFRVRSNVLDLAAGGTAALDLVLEPEMEIAGTVLSPDGEPVFGARIRALPKGEWSGETWREERTLSTTPGTFRLGRLANATYDLRVTFQGFASALVRKVRAGSRDVEVRLERTVRLAGKVAGAYTGDPVTEFRLSLEPGEEDRLSPSEQASLSLGKEVHGPEGAFSIEGLAPGRYLVRIDAPEHLDAEAMLLELPPEDGLEGLVIPVPEKGLLAGTVFDGQARPLAGATVQILRRAVDPITGKFIYRRYPDGDRGRGREGGERGAGADRPRREKDSSVVWPPAGAAGVDASQREYTSRERTGEDGRFWIRGLPDGVYRLSTSHDDFVTGETGDHAIEEGAGGPGANEIAIYLDPGATLTGSVRWMSDVEGGALTVVLTPAGRDARGPGVDRRWRKSAAVDSRGQFKILGLPVGDYFLRADFRRSADGSSASIRRTVGIQDPVREKHIVIDLSR